ncbi:MAG: aminopeptidase N [Pseudomonadota bacterium]
MAKVAVLRQEYTPSAWRIPRVELSFELDDDSTYVTSTLYLECTTPDLQPDIVLDGDGLELLSITFNGLALESNQYEGSPTQLRVPYQTNIGTLTTKVRISPKTNTQLEGLYVCGESLATQCEAQGFRRITWIIDRPDVMSVYTTTLIADAKRYPILLSNGNAADAQQLDGGKHRITWHDPFPKPCYLFACVAGNLSVLESSYVTGSGRHVRLAIYSDPQYLGCLQHGMNSLKRAMRWDEECYGLEYDLDQYLIYCADDFNMGAMENKGLNIFNTKCVLASPETATDEDYINVERVIAHEYFHNWTGNRVTCRDWFQLSFKEGWTVFREAGFAEDMGDAGLVRLQDVDFLRVHQFPEDAGPHAHPVQPDKYLEIDNFYTTTIYEKGAELIRMLAILMGAQAYREACDDFFTQYDGQAVTCQDFLKVMQAHTSLDVNKFERWYHQAGTPGLTVEPSWSKETNTYTLKFKQATPATPGQPHKEPVMIPVKMGLLDASGRSIPLFQQSDGEATEEVTILMDEPEQVFTFHHVKERPIPALLKGFSAPVNLVCELTIDEWLHIVRYEADACIRDGALKTVIRTLVESRLAGNVSSYESSWLTIVGEWLVPERALREPGVIAHLLSLPTAENLSDHFHPFNPLTLVAVRESLEQKICEAHIERLQTLYSVAQQECVSLEMEPYDFSARATGLRALRSRVLSYLMINTKQDVLNLAKTQYAHARCLSDRVGVLSALNKRHSSVRSDILADFKQRYADQPLVLDRVWALEATLSEADVFDRVKTIWESSSFDRRNPNRVRSLLYNLGHYNWSVFHRPDQEPYRFMVDVLKDFDKSNPNLAARLVTVFARWNRFEQPWKTAQKEALETLRSNIHSPNLSELVGKYLDAESV